MEAGRLAPPADTHHSVSHSQSYDTQATSATGLDVEHNSNSVPRRQNTSESQTTSILLSSSHSSSSAITRSHSAHSDGHIHFQDAKSTAHAIHPEPVLIEEPEGINELFCIISQRTRTSYTPSCTHIRPLKTWVLLIYPAACAK